MNFPKLPPAWPRRAIWDSLDENAAHAVRENRGMKASASDDDSCQK
jgi:hypothetical protein